MKKAILNFALAILFCGPIATGLVNAQSPSSIPYQAVARDATGNLISNHPISVRFSIHEGTAGGTVVYRETQSATTNKLGLFNVSVGLGSFAIGPFSNVNWGSGLKFLQVELDPSGGSSYTDMGTSQMLSVPYALYAASSGSLSSNLTGDVTGPQNATVVSSVGGVTAANIASGANAANAATNANTASTIVKRDASGNFSAGTITATLNGNASSASNIAGASAGKVPYQTAAGVTTFTSTTPAGAGLFMRSTGANTWDAGAIQASDLPNSFSGLANPTGAIGLIAVNGSATTAMRSDAAPALSQSIVPTWTGTHTFSNSTYSALFTGGYVGIGTTGPATQLSNTNINTLASDGNGISGNSIAWANNAGGYTASFYNESLASNAEGLAVKMAGTNSSNRLLDLSTGSSQGVTGTQVMIVRGDGKVGIGAGTPNASAVLDISSTTGGVLLPRLNTTQQTAISSPAVGLIIFNTDCNILNCYDGNEWVQVGGTSPTASAASSITATSFTANWSSIPQTTSYFLDVSTVSNFASYLPGYKNLNVGSGTSFNVTGLTACSNYYFRVRAGSACGSSATSNAILTQTLCASCKLLLLANPGLPSGTYNIQPGASPVSCNCDMTTSGGGWTELNSSLSSISVFKGSASWSGSNVVGNNGGTGCGVTPTQYTLNTPSVSFTSVYCLLTRTSSVMQCAGITGQTAAGWYTGTYSGSFTSNGTCLWSDGIWANSTETNMSGLKLNWVFQSSSSNTSLSYITQCSDSGDNGAYTMQWFVK